MLPELLFAFKLELLFVSTGIRIRLTIGFKAFRTLKKSQHVNEKIEAAFEQFYALAA